VNVSDGTDEAGIILGLRSGDPGAWDRLCQEYSRRVRQYVSRLVGRNEHAVADVFQETMLAVARAGRNIRPDSKLWPWLSRIAHNQSALYWRNRYRERADSSHATIGQVDVVAGADNPADDVIQQETNQLVRYVLAQMNADYVAVLTAKYIDNMTIVQVVELVGGTNESVRSRLARARRDFAERYEKLTESTAQLERSHWGEMSSDVSRQS
jgi:RNA polymerase sigma-70 factor (ECF subfamily)